MTSQTIRWQAVHPVCGMESGESVQDIDARNWRKKVLDEVRAFLTGRGRYYSEGLWNVTMFAEDGHRVAQWAIKIERSKGDDRS